MMETMVSVVTGLGARPRRGARRRAIGPTVFVTLLLFALVFALGSIPNLRADGPVTIKVWDHHIHDKKFRQSIFKEFNKANPDIKIEYTSQIAGTYPTLLDAAFRSGTPPDIFNPIGIAIPKVVEMGWIQPLEDVAPSKEVFDRWVARFPAGQQPFLENVNVVNGKIYSWPVGGEAGRMMLFWNTNLFEEAGLKSASGGPAVPETWADFRGFARKITEYGQGKIYGLVFGAKDNRGAWDMNLHSSLAISAGWYEAELPGGGFNYNTGRYDYERGFKKAVQLLVDIRNDGSLFPGELAMDDEQAKFRFSQGLSGMIFGGSWVPGGLLAISPDLSFDAILPPTEERGVRKGYPIARPTANNYEYVVWSKTKSREAVWKVIDFMTSQRYQEEWVKAGGGISVFPEYNKIEYFPHPTIGKIAQMGVTGKRTVPELPPGAAKVWEFFQMPKPDPYDIIEGFWVGQLGFSAWDEFGKKENAELDKALVEARKVGVNLTRADFTFPDFNPFENYHGSAASFR